VFMINTEISEIACVLHLHIPGTTMSSWLVVRANIVLGTSPRNVCRNALETLVL
jgi:hypothetical protein